MNVFVSGIIRRKLRPTDIASTQRFLRHSRSGESQKTGSIFFFVYSLSCCFEVVIESLRGGSRRVSISASFLLQYKAFGLYTKGNDSRRNFDFGMDQCQMPETYEFGIFQQALYVRSGVSQPASRAGQFFLLLCGIFIRLVLLTAILPRREYRTHIALFVSPLSHLASQREISRPNESTSKPSLR